MNFELLVSEIEQACKDHGVTVLRAVPYHIEHVPTFRVEDEVSPSKVIHAAKATTTIVYLDVLRLTRADLERAIALASDPAGLEKLRGEVGKICAITLYLPSQNGFLTEWHKFAPWYPLVFEERYRNEDEEDDALSAKEEELAARAARLLAMGKTKKMVAKLLGISVEELEGLI